VSGTHAIMTGVGYDNRAVGFSTTNGHAGAANDQVWLYGSSNANTFNAYSDRVEMLGAGFANTAYGFDHAYAYGSVGDTANLHGGAGDDALRAYRDRTILTGAGYEFRVYGFDEVDAEGYGGNDSAWLYDDAGDDNATMSGAAARIDYADGKSVSATGFDSVHATSSAGGDDTLDLSAVDYYFEGIGDWS